MPHVYKMSQHQKTKGIKKKKKQLKRKGLKSEMHTKCLEKV